MPCARPLTQGGQFYLDLRVPGISDTYCYMMQPEPIDILELPDVLLERILYTCDIRTIATAAAVCKALQRVAECESLWLKLCQREFVNTDPTRWHSSPRVDHVHSEGRLSDYRHAPGPCVHRKLA